MGKRTDVALWAVFLVAVAAVGGAGFVALRSVQDFVRAAEWEVHSQEMLASIERVGRLMREAESARRGFALTRDDVHRADYQEAERGLRAALLDLERLTRSASI